MQRLSKGLVESGLADKQDGRGAALKRTASIIGIVGLGALVWGVGVATNAEPGPVRASNAVAGPVRKAPEAATGPVDAASDQRARLNSRISAMLASGEGARLREPVVRPAPVHRAAAAAPRQARPARPAAAVPTSASIAPAAGLRTASLSAPRLDLTTRPDIPASEMECLTQALYYEARNESDEGQAAVAEVVLNRARSGRYPKGICEVVYQRNARTCQFTFTCDGSIGRRPINPVAWRRSEAIARSVYHGANPAILPANSVNYHANYVSPSWGRRLQRVKQIGAHIFYGAPLNGGFTPGAESQPRSLQSPPGLQFISLETLIRNAREGGSRAESTAS
jgi:spore germination cell wall hydrolase CwlJ-like protein